MASILPPTFLYAGPPKSASSWLAQILSEHPDVYVPPAKDIMYFDRHYDRPIEWYYGFFASRGTRSQAGEVCHNYFDCPLAAERIKIHLPDVKLVFMLRDPVARTVSHWLFERALGKDSDFATFSQRSDIAAINDYTGNLQRYLSRFPANQIKILFYSQLKEDPAALVRSLYEFLGVDTGFVPPSLHTPVLPARQARLGPLSAFAYQSAQLLRALGGANIVGGLKKIAWLQNLLFRDFVDMPQAPPQDLKRLFERQVKTFPELSQLIGQELPALWYQPPAGAGGA